MPIFGTKPDTDGLTLALKVKFMNKSILAPIFVLSGSPFWAPTDPFAKHQSTVPRSRRLHLSMTAPCSCATKRRRSTVIVYGMMFTLNASRALRSRAGGRGGTDYANLYPDQAYNAGAEGSATSELGSGDARICRCPPPVEVRLSPPPVLGEWVRVLSSHYDPTGANRATG
jgi:hypothetical protein